MGFLFDGLKDAVRLIASGDQQILDAALRTLSISLSAVALAILIGLPIATCLARRPFFGHRLRLGRCRAGRPRLGGRPGGMCRPLGGNTRGAKDRLRIKNANLKQFCSKF